MPDQENNNSYSFNVEKLGRLIAMTEQNAASLTRIEEYVKKQNGRVYTLEKDKISRHEFERYQDAITKLLDIQQEKYDKLVAIVWRITIVLSASGLTGVGVYSFFGG